MAVSGNESTPKQANFINSGVSRNTTGKVVKANSFIQIKNYPLNRRESQVFLYMISHLKRGDEEFKVYKFYMKELIDLFNLGKGKWGNAYKEFEEVVLSLKEKQIILDEGKKRYYLSFVNDIAIERGTGEITFQISDTLKPYLLQLKKNFTVYDLYNIIPLQSVYSIRIYELLKQYETLGRVRMTLEELRDFLSIGKDEYKQYSGLKRRTIQRAYDELRTHTDVCFTYKEEKKGRSVSAIEFTILSNEPEEKPDLPQLPLFASVNKERELVVKALTDTGMAEADAKKLWDQVQRRSATIPGIDDPSEHDWASYFGEKIELMKWRLKSGDLKKPFGFLAQALLENYSTAGLKQQRSLEAKRQKDRQAAQSKAAEAAKKAADLKTLSKHLEELNKACVGKIIKGDPKALEEAVKNVFRTDFTLKRDKRLRKLPVEEAYNESSLLRAAVTNFFRETRPDVYAEYEKTLERYDILKSQQ